MDRPERQRYSLNEIVTTDDWPDLPKELTDVPNGSRVLEIGGIGIFAEILSQSNDVALINDERLYTTYRKNILPNSAVECINVDPARLIINKPQYDYVIVNVKQYVELANSLAKTGVYNTITESYKTIETKEELKELTVEKDLEEDEDKNETTEKLTESTTTETTESVSVGSESKSTDTPDTTNAPKPRRRRKKKSKSISSNNKSSSDEV